jgi:hypothetical protein
MVIKKRQKAEEDRLVSILQFEEISAKMDAANVMAKQLSAEQTPALSVKNRHTRSIGL